MAEYNGVYLEPLTDGALDRDYQVEQLVFWGAGRAALLAVSPKFSNVGLCANATYMVTAIARLYDVEIKTGAIFGLVGGLSTASATAALSLLVPVKAVRVPVAIGLTYAIGKVANIWIQDGMPSDINRYKPMLADFIESGKAMVGEIARDASANIPFTQCQRDLWAGIANEAAWQSAAVKDQYDVKIAPIKEKWHAETKYTVHDSAATAVAKVTDTVGEKVCAMKDIAGGASEIVKASASLMTEAVKETAKTKINEFRNR